MALAYLIDENLRGILIHYLLRSALQAGLLIDVLQVGDLHAPPRGTSDRELLIWTEAQDRILISNDVSTLPVHLAAHVAAGRSSPGVILVTRNRWTAIAEQLVLIAYATGPDEWRNRAGHAF